jgi:hypothetical protein
MALDKQKKLVDLLLKKTSAGELDWRETPDDQKFQVSLKSGSVRIEELEKPSTIDFEIQVLNEDGVVVESFLDTDLDGGSQEPKWFKKMKDLHELARRTVTGSEKILNSLLDELEDEMPF